VRGRFAQFPCLALHVREPLSITVVSTSIWKYFVSILCSLSGTELSKYSRTMGMAYRLLCNSRVYFSFPNQLLYILNWCHLLYSLFCTCSQRSFRQFRCIVWTRGKQLLGHQFPLGILCIIPWTFDSRRTPVSTNYRRADGNTSFAGGSQIMPARRSYSIKM